MIEPLFAIGDRGETRGRKNENEKKPKKTRSDQTPPREQRIPFRRRGTVRATAVLRLARAAQCRTTLPQNYCGHGVNCTIVRTSYHTATTIRLLLLLLLRLLLSRRRGKRDGGPSEERAELPASSSCCGGGFRVCARRAQRKSCWNAAAAYFAYFFFPSMHNVMLLPRLKRRNNNYLYTTMFLWFKPIQHL